MWNRVPSISLHMRHAHGIILRWRYLVQSLVRALFVLWFLQGSPFLRLVFWQLQLESARKRMFSLRSRTPRLSSHSFSGERRWIDGTSLPFFGSFLLMHVFLHFPIINQNNNSNESRLVDRNGRYRVAVWGESRHPTEGVGTVPWVKCEYFLVAFRRRTWHRNAFKWRLDGAAKLCVN